MATWLLILAADLRYKEDGLGFIADHSTFGLSVAFTGQSEKRDGPPGPHKRLAEKRAVSVFTPGIELETSP